MEEAMGRAMDNTMKKEMQTAFKEWTVVVDALEQGDQILILRKGGIREGKAGFQVVADSFWLFPTQFHQQREAVIDTAQARYDQIRPATADEPTPISIQSYAQVCETKELDDWDVVARLKSQHIWRDEVIRERFEWGQKRGIFALVVRVFRLPEPVLVPMRPQYGGCRSWTDLEPPISTKLAQPVLDEAAFEQQLKSFHQLVEV